MWSPLNWARPSRTRGTSSILLRTALPSYGEFKNLYYHEVRVSDYPLFDYQPYKLVLPEDGRSGQNLTTSTFHALRHSPRECRDHRADILAKEGINLPIVTTLHGTDITLLGKDPAFELVIAHAINESDAVTAVSHSLKRDTLELFGVNREIEVIHNFISPSHFERDADEQFRRSVAPNGEPIITHISNFRPVKRVEDG